MDNIEAGHDPVQDDQKVDNRAILVVFVALVLGAVHYVSGWTF